MSSIDKKVCCEVTLHISLFILLYTWYCLLPDEKNKCTFIEKNLCGHLNEEMMGYALYFLMWLRKIIHIYYSIFIIDYKNILMAFSTLTLPQSFYSWFWHTSYLLIYDISSFPLHSATLVDISVKNYIMAAKSELSPSDIINYHC